MVKFMKEIKTPITEDQINDLNLSSSVYFTGTMFTARDLAHKRIFEYLNESKKLPIDLDGSVLYHCGPLVFNDKVYSAGPTTSARMNKYEPTLIEHGLRVIIGKGGMDRSVQKALKNHKGIYLTFTGGAGALAATFIKNVKNVYWKDLGVAEAIWEFEVEKFGPLIVTIDSKGNSL